MDKVIRIFRSFPESERANKHYYLSLSPEQRMEILSELIQQGQPDEAKQGFERVYRIVKLNQNKRAVQRPQDLADLNQITELPAG